MGRTLQTYNIMLYRKDDSYLMLHRVSVKNDETRTKWIGIGGHFEEGSPEDCLFKRSKRRNRSTLTS